MFDYLSQELPSLQYSLGLFTVTGVASGLLANYLPHKNAFCNYKYNFSDSKTMLGKGLIFGVVVGLAAHYGAERGRRVYLDRTAFSNSMKAFEDEVLARRARKAELLKMLAELKE